MASTVRLYYLSLLPSHLAPPVVLFSRRRYYWSLLCPARVPPHAVSFLPDGLRVNKVGDTCVSIVDNFCTPEEASKIIAIARGRLKPRGVIINNKAVLSERRTSETALVYSEGKGDSCVLQFLIRGSMLTGLPYTHAEAVYVTRYAHGEKFDSHLDCAPGYFGDRLYSILVYLNDLESGQGGETEFEELGLTVQPRCGRAVTWVNKNPDGFVHTETRHAANPVTGDVEKWVIQLWFRRYKSFR
jgi:prolyl 4-hydroxylase